MIETKLFSTDADPVTGSKSNFAIEWPRIDQIQHVRPVSCSPDREKFKTTWLFEKRPRFSWVMKLFTLRYDVIFPFLTLYMIMISHFHKFGNNFQIDITQSKFYHFLKSWWVLESIFPELQDPHLIFSNPWKFHRDKKSFCKIISKHQKNLNILLAIFKAS